MLLFFGGLVHKDERLANTQGVMLSYFTDVRNGKPNKVLRRAMKRVKIRKSKGIK